ncbi:FHA domain-containing protein [Paludisphaera soli]|uniref:FHA domain-containing protein n=1 Tax=Paludisphaera soli TaxID=2712865 RepID=UPI0013EB7B65|nr:FHA domain-containing protein [Paludisphaera soli]
MENPRLGLVLLDSPDGAPRQHWSFDARPVIRIGRSTDNDVVVADQHVSRDHVFLTADGDGWLLTVVSPQGIYCGPRKFLSLRLDPRALEGFVFRLGAKGPFLRLDAQAEPACGESTLAHDRDQHPLLVLDADRLRDEVEEISRGDYFRSLKESLGRLRPSRSEDPAEP